MTEPDPEAARRAVVEVLYQLGSKRACIPIPPDAVAARLMVRTERVRYWLTHAQREGFVQLVHHDHAGHYQLTEAGLAWARAGYPQAEGE